MFTGRLLCFKETDRYGGLNHVIHHVFLGKDADVAWGESHAFTHHKLVGQMVLVWNHHLNVLA